MKKARKRLLERMKHIKHRDWHCNYYFAINRYVMSRILGKSRHCQRELGKYMVLMSVGMRYGYGYTFTRLRQEIRRRTDLWESALRIRDAHALRLHKAVDDLDAIYGKFRDWKFSLRDRGYNGLTIYQPVFPSDIEHREEVRRRPKNRYKHWPFRRRKAHKLKRDRKKNWKYFMPEI